MVVTNLKVERVRAGIRAFRLAQLAGITSTELSHYETGRRVPPIPVRKKLADILSCDPVDLFPADEKVMP